MMCWLLSMLLKSLMSSVCDPRFLPGHSERPLYCWSPEIIITCPDEGVLGTEEQREQGSYFLAQKHSPSPPSLYHESLSPTHSYSRDPQIQNLSGFWGRILLPGAGEHLASQAGAYQGRPLLNVSSVRTFLRATPLGPALRTLGVPFPSLSQVGTGSGCVLGGSPSSSCSLLSEFPGLHRVLLLSNFPTLPAVFGVPPVFCPDPIWGYALRSFNAFTTPLADVGVSGSEANFPYLSKGCTRPFPSLSPERLSLALRGLCDQ